MHGRKFEVGKTARNQGFVERLYQSLCVGPIEVATERFLQGHRRDGELRAKSPHYFSFEVPQVVAALETFRQDLFDLDKTLNVVNSLNGENRPFLFE